MTMKGNNSFYNNTSTTGDGGAIYLRDNIKNITIENTSFLENNSFISGGAFYLFDGNNITLN